MSALAYLYREVWDDDLYSLWAYAPAGTPGDTDEIFIDYPLTVRRTDGVDETLTVRQVLRLARRRISANSHRAAVFRNLADLASGDVLGAAVQFRADGTTWAVEGATLTQLANWYWPTTAGAGAGFEIQFITTASSPAAAGSATPPAFLGLSTNRSASVARTQAAGAGVNTATVAYNIRRAGQTAGTASGSLELRAEIEAAPAGGGSSLGTLTVRDTSTRPADASDAAIAAIELNTDGTITYTGSGAGGASNWHSPTTAGIGSSRWVKFTLDSGNAWDSGLTAGTVYALSSARSLQWSRDTAGSKSASATVQIYSDAAGTTLVATGIISAFVLLTVTGGGA